MGCVFSSMHTQEGTIKDSQDGISVISYRRRVEKIANGLNQSNTVGEVSLWRKISRKKRYQNQFATASNVINEDVESYPSLSTMDINAITDRHKHWQFPKWGAYKKCHVCDVNCKSNKKRCSIIVNEVRNNARASVASVGADNLAFGDLLALNALDLTVPASDALLKNRKNAWIQLAGHPGSFAPAGPNTIWKKRLSKDNNETTAYQTLMNDTCRDIVPKFFREVEYNGDFFIEMEDLLQHFTDPCIMDIKMGTRTFLESEVKNPVLRKDLYEKMVKLDTKEPTADENEQKAITKLRYMQFREKQSSTSTLGFRIEAMKMSGETPYTDLKKVKTQEEVKRTIARFLGNNQTVHENLMQRLHEIRDRFESSTFFKHHEVIGSSLLILFDQTNKSNAWIIDFAKTQRVERETVLTHRKSWSLGSHEDGFLIGLDHLIEVMREVNADRSVDTNININLPEAKTEKADEEQMEKT